MKILIFLTLSLFSLSLFAQEEALREAETQHLLEQQPESQRPSFGVSSIVTLSPMDSFYRMPPSDYYVKPLDKVFRGERFRFLPVLNNIVKNDGDSYAFECTLSMFKDGFSGGTVLMDEKLIEGVMANKNSVLFFPFDLFLAFSDTDDFGLYNIIFKTRNLKTREIVSITKQITLAEWQGAKKEFSQEEINSFVFIYNTSYDLEGFYSSFLSKDLNFYKKTGLNGFDSLLISYYKQVFEDNEFLFDSLLEEFPTMDEESRKRVIMLCSFMQKDKFDEAILNSQEIIFQNYIYGEFDFNFKPYEGEVFTSSDLEVLWGEFFARGNYRPIERLLQAYEYKDEADYVKKVFAKELPVPSNKAEETDLAKGKLYFIVDNYFRSYKASPILERYLHWALANVKSENIKDALSLVLGGA